MAQFYQQSMSTKGSVTAQRNSNSIDPLALDSARPEPVGAQQPPDGPVSGPAVHVHVASRLTPAVLGFLGPACRVLAQRGARQILIAMDDAQSKAAIRSLPDSIRCVHISARSVGPMVIVRMVQALRSVAQDHDLGSLHLHGLNADLAGTIVLPSIKDSGALTVFCSPHSSRLLQWSPGAGALLLRLLDRVMGRTRRHLIVHQHHEARLLASLGSEGTSLVEGSVDPGFFEISDSARPANDSPRIVGSGPQSDARGARRFAQLAVLMGDAGPRGIRFEWIGHADEVDRAQLKASGALYSGYPVTSDRQQRLQAATLFLAPARGRGFPLALAEAMAAGLPCVALDEVEHRDFIRDGVNGFLCKDERQMAQRAAELLDDPVLARKMGVAARQVAWERFSADQFERNFLNSYSDFRS